MKILFKLASRSRPQKFFAAIDNIIEKTESNEFAILASLDKDDPTMMNRDVLNRIKGYMQSGINITPVYGISKNKIDAINRDVNECKYDWDILINTSDDMTFTKNGFDTLIREKVKANHKDLDVFLHFPDGYANEKLCTLSIMGRKYYERFKYIYHPSYASLYCDDEATQVAKLLNKHAYYDDKIFVHNHPSNVGGFMDELLIHTESFHPVDKTNFEMRKANKFDLKL